MGTSDEIYLGEYKSLLYFIPPGVKLSLFSLDGQQFLCQFSQFPYLRTKPGSMQAVQDVAYVTSFPLGGGEQN